MKKVENIRKVASYTEYQAIKLMLNEVKTEKIINTGDLAKVLMISRSIFVNALKLLAVTEIVECRSLGMKGTYVKILNQEAAQALMQ